MEAVRFSGAVKARKVLWSRRWSAQTIGAARITGTVALAQTVIIGGFNVGPLVPFIAPQGIGRVHVE
jgi:hypothetical protein